MKKNSRRVRASPVNTGRMIARRTLTVVGAKQKKVTVSHGIPRRVGDDEWSCPISIKGLAPKPIRDFAHGVDSVQALLLGAQCIRWHLMQSGLTFEWNGDAELGGNRGGIPRTAMDGMGKQYDSRVDVIIRRETNKVQKHRALLMRLWQAEEQVYPVSKPRHA